MKPKAEPRPPRIARIALRLLLPGPAYEAIAGDLEEEFNHRCSSPLGTRPARRWYRREALVSLLATRRPDPTPHRPSPRLRWQPMSDLLLDLRHALRVLVTNPGLSATVVATLALGIGATTSIFTVVDATLLRPLPYAAPGELVALYEENLERGFTRNQASPANFLSWRERAESLTDASVHGWIVGWALAGGDRPEWVRGTPVFFNFFDVLGAPPQLGRAFDEDDNWQSSSSVVISHGLWQRAFGGEPGLVGATIQLDGRDRTVVGIAPEGFSYPEPGLDVWSPMRWRREDVGQAWFRRAHYVNAFGRMKPGVRVSEAHAEIQTIASDLAREYPETNAGFGAGAISLRDWVVGDARTTLILLAAAVGAVLLIACANIANLLLARAGRRTREIAIRGALGAGRGRIARQLLTESLVLAAAGGAAALVVASLMTRTLLAFAADAIPRAEEVALDLRVLGFASAITVLAGIAFGLAPALTLAARSAGAALGDRSSSAGSSRGRQLLVVAEVALALMLVAGAALMLRSLRALGSVDPGFEPRNLLAAELEIPGARYPDKADSLAFYDRLETRLLSVPGFEAVGFADSLPIEGTFWTSDFEVEGRAVQETDAIVEFNRRLVSRGYFDAMQISLHRGRTFDTREQLEAPPVVVVNDVLARRYFPGEDVVGQRIRFGSDADDPWHTVIGIVGATKLQGLQSRAWPEIYMAAEQLPLARASVLVRFDARAADPGGLLRAELAGVDPLIPLIRLERFEEIITRSLVDEALLATLLALFAALAMLLAVLGVYGILAYTVAAQTHEIGVRMALGARAPDVVRMVVTRAAAVAGAGIALGLGAYLAVAHWMRSVLFEISPTDPATLIGVVATLAGAALLASYLPARRASRVDPLASLRGN